MATIPQFAFYLAGRANPVEPRHSLWQTPLPQSRRHFTGETDAGALAGVSHGAYFDAARRFLAADRCAALVGAVAAVRGRPLAAEKLERVDIVLEKHGEYYHPSRVEVDARGERTAFVLNVAVNASGRTFLQNEYRLLQRLLQTYAWPFVPPVYCQGEVELAGTRPAAMFLGRWFEGYHEFHLARDPATGTNRLRVWDPAGGNPFLSMHQTRAVYEQAATILTAYFNLETYEQIFAWHHAAGDFVLNTDRPVPDIKLITVRHYAPLFAKADNDPETLMEALLLFLLNLSIRMRLDRLDGVADVAWSEEVAVAATVTGFFNGLDLQLEASGWPRDVAAYFRKYLKMHSKDDLLDTLAAVVARYDPNMPGKELVTACLPSHAASLHAALEGI